ncbi:hypothetical protein EFW57_03751 [Bacillus velezensis]|nr:hypothetical protein EFW57_03751 [Bacillus velezensis]
MIHLNLHIYQYSHFTPRRAFFISEHFQTNQKNPGLAYH